MVSGVSRHIDIQGHRGCRGLRPENTIPAFLHALDLGVDTLEMDIIISGDGQVVVSHEAYLHHAFCLDSQGHEIPESGEKTFNLFRMPYSRIQSFECGLKPHPLFPDQVPVSAYKPLLEDVITSSEAHSQASGRPLPRYNIEIKMLPEDDGIFNPDPETFIRTLLKVPGFRLVKERVTLQSFDYRPLQLLHQIQPEITLALLIEDHAHWQSHLDKLGFIPQIYSPDFTLLHAGSVSDIHQAGMKVIPWTLNAVHDMIQAITWEVDGIITDYPNLALSLLNRAHTKLT